MVLRRSSDGRQRLCQSQAGKQPPVKIEIEDLEDEHEHAPVVRKRKHSSVIDQITASSSLFPTKSSKFNPLEEPSPLGLRLRKSPSLLELIQMRLSHGDSSTPDSAPDDDVKPCEKVHTKGSAGSVTTDKLKASNFSASLLRIGCWEYTSRHEGDLVAKCYFAKHKLVWEILEGGLKSKIEIQWSDIMGLKADCPDDAPATLIVVLARQPLFFRETNPQPRKHTLWQATIDFTDGQASMHRKHFLQIPHGLLNKHFEKLVQCDMRLNFLSRQPEISLDSPYFESQPSIFEGSNESKNFGSDHGETSKGPSSSIFEDVVGPSVSQSSITFKQEDVLFGAPEIMSHDTSSPSSVMDTHVIEGIASSKLTEMKRSKSFDQQIRQGLHPSMSMNDVVSHIENCISGQKCSEDSILVEEGKESHKALEDIAQHLLSDFQFTPCSDEKSLMSRVDSLCSLIQKDGAPVQSCEVVPKEGHEAKLDSHNLELMDEITHKDDIFSPDVGAIDMSGYRHAPDMPRRDSFGDLLLHLPRIASLPKFLFDISEDGDNQAR